MIGPRSPEGAVSDPEPTLGVLRFVAAQRWKPVIGDERAAETEATLAIPWSGPGFSLTDAEALGQGAVGRVREDLARAAKILTDLGIDPEHGEGDAQTAAG